MFAKVGRLPAAWKRRLLILPPLIVGLAAIGLAPMIRSKPAQVAPVERAVKVRAIKLTPTDVVPRAVGYGTIKPDKAWEAVAEVAGQVEWVSDDLKNGRRVAEGTELLRIEDADYRLALTQIEAQLQASDMKDKTTRASLAIAERELRILEDDFARKKGLVERGTAAQTTVEAAERQMLNGQAQVQNLKNILAINAVERQVLTAQRESTLLDLARTRIAAPFDVRITDVRIGEAQYANKGQMLFAADGVARAEAEAQFSIGVLRPLISAVTQGGANGMDPHQAVTGLNALVRLRTATHVVEWPARIERTTGVVDPQTQSIGVVVAIDDPEGQAMPTRRPRLLRNTFVEVQLTAPSMAGQIVVPRAAIDDGQLHVVDAESRLGIRKVRIAFIQGNFAVIANGVGAGEWIVISDLASPIKGMRLDPQEDRKAKHSLAAEAKGEELQP